MLVQHLWCFSRSASVCSRSRFFCCHLGLSDSFLQLAFGRRCACICADRTAATSSVCKCSEASGDFFNSRSYTEAARVRLGAFQAARAHDASVLVGFRSRDRERALRVGAPRPTGARSSFRLPVCWSVTSCAVQQHVLLNGNLKTGISCRDCQGEGTDNFCPVTARTQAPHRCLGRL